MHLKDKATMRVKKKKTILGIFFTSIVKTVEFSCELLHQVSLKVQKIFYNNFLLKNDRSKI